MRASVMNIAILFVLSASALIFWYTPILFKGYHPDVINDQIVLARNLAESGKFTLYNGNGVVISSYTAKEFGEESTIGNKFTAYIYSGIFKYLGVLSLEKITFISVFLNTLALFVFSLTVLYLFNIKIAVVFSLIYAFLPFNWRNIYFLGNYEFAVLFLSLFFLFFLFGIYDGKKSVLKFVSLLVSGGFLSFAVLAKDAFILLLPSVFLSIALKELNKEKNLKENIKKIFYGVFPVFISVVAILGILYFPGFISGKNIYKSQLLAKRPQNSLDWSLAGHFYPDYYTYRYEREKFLEDFISRNKGFIESVYLKKAAGNVGEGISIFERIVVGSVLFFSHVMRFVSLEEIGGPFILLFSLFGFVFLYKKEKFLFNLFSLQIFLIIFILSFIALAGRTHLMDFAFSVALLAALGIFYAANFFSENLKLSFLKRNLIFFGISGFAVYHLLLVSHIVWGKAYDGSMLKLMNYANEIKRKNLSENDVIVTGLRHDENLTLNFLADKPVIVFRPETLEKLTREKKMKEVFKEFKIKYALGYSPEITEEIKKESGVEIIIIEGKNYKFSETSRFKMWLMGLIR